MERPGNRTVVNFGEQIGAVRVYPRDWNTYEISLRIRSVSDSGKLCQNGQYEPKYGWMMTKVSQMMLLAATKVVCQFIGQQFSVFKFPDCALSFSPDIAFCLSSFDYKFLNSILSPCPSIG